MSDQTWPDVVSSARVLVSRLPEEALHNAGSLCLSSESLCVDMSYNVNRMQWMLLHYVNVSVHFIETWGRG